MKLIWLLVTRTLIVPCVAIGGCGGLVMSHLVTDVGQPRK